MGMNLFLVCALAGHSLFFSEYQQPFHEVTSAIQAQERILIVDGENHMVSKLRAMGIEAYGVCTLGQCPDPYHVVAACFDLPFRDRAFSELYWMRASPNHQFAMKWVQGITRAISPGGLFHFDPFLNPQYRSILSSEGWEKIEDKSDLDTWRKPESRAIKGAA